MRMPLSGCLHDGMLHLTLLLLLLWHPGSGLQVTAPASVTAMVQSPVVLPCSFSVDSPPVDPQYLAVIWYFGDKELLRFDNKNYVVQSGVSMDKLQVRNGNVSLTIQRVTVSSQGTYKCLVIYSPNTLTREIQLNVHASPEVQIHRRALDQHKNSRLHCSISHFYPVDMRVTWLLNGQVVSGSEFGEVKTNADGTFRVNSSLELTSAQIQNHPVITCHVEHVSLQRAIEDSFTVQYGVAPVVRLSSLAAEDGNEQIYVCEARGFSPEGISIDWTSDVRKVNNSDRGPDQRFNKAIYYRVNLREDKPPPGLSCAVRHETQADPIIESINVKQFNECQRSCHHGVTALFAFLLILALVFMIYYYFFIWWKDFPVCHIYADQRWTEERVIFYCMASECRGEAEVIWTVIEDGKEPIEISDPPKNNTDEETGLLLQPAELSLKNNRSQEGGRHNVTSILTFKLEGSKPCNLEVRCKFLYSGKSIEKSMKSTFHNYKKPEISKTDPIEVSLDDSGNVVCSLTLEKFFPKEIDIKWSHEDGQISTRVTSNYSHTYNAVSECRVPAHLFQDPHFRVRVEWSHQSMDKPESHGISVKDLPWLPVMDDIIVPPLIHGRDSSFRCIIRRYFLDNLEVKWFRREAGKSELYEVNSGDKYKFPVKEVTREPDQTFTTVSTLIASLTMEDEGSEFICRVTQPRLENPPQKATGGLNVTGKPTVRRALQDRSQIILKVEGFYMPDLRVIWERADKEYGSYKRIEEKYIQNKMEVCEDGSHTLTSICDAMGISDRMNPNDLYFKATLHHGSLKSPEETIFLRRKGIFYLITKSGPRLPLDHSRNVSLLTPNIPATRHSAQPPALSLQQ